MTDDDVEKIIKRNMNLQMNLAGIRADFEEHTQRTWVGLTDEDIEMIVENKRAAHWEFVRQVEALLKEKNHG